MFTPSMETIREQVKALIDLIPTIGEIEKQLNATPRDLDLIADVTFLCRKSDQIFDAVQKRLNKLEAQAATNFHRMMEAGILEEKTYKNENCTVSDNTDFYVPFPQKPGDEVKFPKDDREGSAEITLKYDDFIKELPLEAMRPHYPVVCDLITKQVAEGGQVPFGLNRFGLVALKPKLRMTSKKEL